MTTDDRLQDSSQQDHGSELTIESSDSAAPAVQRKDALPAKSHKNRRNSTRGANEPKENRPASEKMDEARTGFEVPIGSTGAVVQSAWRFGA